MTTFILKIIAMLTMFIDHFGSVFMNNNFYARFIGRIAFIIYAYLLVKSFLRRSDDKRFKHMSRLFILFLLTEIPYDLLFKNQYFDFKHQNNIQTLMLGFLMMLLMEKTKNEYLKYGYIIFFAFLNIALYGDYGWYGIILIWLFYEFLKDKEENEKLKLWEIIAIVGVFTGCQYLEIFLNSSTEYLAVWKNHIFRFVNLGNFLAVPLIYFHNLKMGYNSFFFKWFYRLFYCGHLLLLYLVKMGL